MTKHPTPLPPIAAVFKDARGERSLREWGRHLGVSHVAVRNFERGHVSLSFLRRLAASSNPAHRALLHNALRALEDELLA